MGTNRYAYALNDPVNRSDPSGRNTVEGGDTITLDTITVTADAPDIPGEGGDRDNSGYDSSRLGTARTSYACYGCGVVVGGAVTGYVIGDNIRNGYYGGKANPDLTSGPLFTEEVEEEKDLDFWKVDKDLAKRGWTKEEIKEVVKGKPNGTSVDERKPENTREGNKLNEPATVWGSPDTGYVVVNDRTKEVVQISDKNGPWSADDRIKWNQ